MCVGALVPLGPATSGPPRRRDGRRWVPAPPDRARDQQMVLRAPAAGAPSSGVRGPEGTGSSVRPAPGPAPLRGTGAPRTAGGRGGPRRRRRAQVGRVTRPGARRLPVCGSPALAREPAAGGAGCPLRTGAPGGEASLPGQLGSPLHGTPSAETSAAHRARAVPPRYSAAALAPPPRSRTGWHRSGEHRRSRRTALPFPHRERLRRVGHRRVPRAAEGPIPRGPVPHGVRVPVDPSPNLQHEGSGFPPRPSGPAKPAALGPGCRSPARALPAEVPLGVTGSPQPYPGRPRCLTACLQAGAALGARAPVPVPSSPGVSVPRLRPGSARSGSSRGGKRPPVRGGAGAKRKLGAGGVLAGRRAPSRGG